MKQCSKCGQSLADSAEFCSSCGSAVEAAAAQVASPSVAAPPTAVPPPTPRQMSAAPVKARTSGLAIGALVCGILGLGFCPIGVVGLILGIVALGQIKNDRTGLTGSGLAITGIATGAFSIVLVPIVLAVLFPVFAKARAVARATNSVPNCISHQRQVAVAMLMYAQDHNEQLPASASVWSSITVNPSSLTCPALPDTPNGYGYNAQMSNRALGECHNPAGTLITADSSSTTNLINTEADIDARHNNQFVAGYVDGHAALLPAGTAVTLK